MSLAGLISGVMGGAAKGYTDVAQGELKKQQELDFRKELMAAEEQKMLRIDEIKRNRDVADIGRRTTAEADARLATAGTNARADVAAKVATFDAADAAGLPAKEAGYKGKQLAANAPNVEIEARQRGTAAATEQTARTDAPGYLASVAKETSAKESSASKASAAASGFELAQKKALADLRSKLSQTTDPDQRATLTQQIGDLSGGSQKSYADMVTAGDSFRKLAANLRQQLKDDLSLSETEQADIKQRIQLYEEQAASILGTTVDKRLGAGASKPPQRKGPTNEAADAMAQARDAVARGASKAAVNARLKSLGFPELP